MRRRRPRLPPLLLGLALLPAGLAAGCASGGDADADRIRELQDRVLELQRKAAVADVELARLRQQVAELMARGGSSVSAPSSLSGSGGTAGAAGAYQAPAVSPPGNASASASGGGRRSAEAASPAAPAPPASRSAAAGRGTSPRWQSPPAAHPAPTSPASAPGAVVAGGMTETDIEMPAGPRPMAAPAERQPPPAVSGSAAGAAAGAGRRAALPETPPQAATQPRGEAVTPAVQALYDRGYTLYHQKHYVDAEASFQRFLQAEPGSELADNAQYWIGECRYSRGDMRGALAAFREAVTRYPQGIKTPDALLKTAMCLEALGDREGARGTYQDVLRRFPGTAVAAVAEERRAKLP